MGHPVSNADEVAPANSQADARHDPNCLVAVSGSLQPDRHDTIRLSVTERPSTPATGKWSCSSETPPADRKDLPFDSDHHVDVLAGLNTSNSLRTHPPQVISDGDLRDQHEDHVQRSSHADLAETHPPIDPAAADAIRGRGLPDPDSIQENTDVPPDPTIITDLGERLALVTTLGYDDNCEVERTPSPLH